MCIANNVVSFFQKLILSLSPGEGGGGGLVSEKGKENLPHHEFQTQLQQSTENHKKQLAPPR